MRFYTQRACPKARSPEDYAEIVKLRGLDKVTDAQRRRYDELRVTVSDRIEIVDGTGEFQDFNVSERDAETLCAYLNIGDRQDKLCQV